MRNRVRALLALAVAVVGVGIGLGGYVQPPIQFTGVTLRMEPYGFVVDTIDPRSTAAGVLEPNMRVVAVNDLPPAELLRLDPDKDLFMSGDFIKLTVEGELGATIDVSFAAVPEPPDRLPFLLGLALLVGISLVVGRGVAGDALRPLALPLASASAAPLLVSPAWSDPGPIGIGAAIGLPAIATLSLGDGFLARIRIPLAHRIAVLALAIAGVGIPVTTAALAIDARPEPGLSAGNIALLVSIATALAAGLALLIVGGVAVSTARVDPAQSTTHRGDRLPILMAAITPVVTAVSVGFIPLGFGVSLPLVWLLVAVVILQTNARFEILRFQRDTVVAATEAERARLAADLHDDALQQMSVLVRRLDEEGADADAAMARSIADRLRDVCGDLRLPILDELGAGPALEWLVARISDASKGEVLLERADTARPPAQVELAFFRVAQEALSNAVRHGAAPIRVEYESSAEHAELSIIDHGGGIPEHAAMTAPRSGHYGLLNMRQRAEQIGAELELRHANGGGTSVALRWASA